MNGSTDKGLHQKDSKKKITGYKKNRNSLLKTEKQTR